MYYGTLASLPAGWSEFTTSTNRWIRGSTTIGSTGGSASVTFTPTLSTESWTHEHLDNVSSSKGTFDATTTNRGHTSKSVSHSHTSPSFTVSNLPPYYSLYYIVGA